MKNKLILLLSTGIVITTLLTGCFKKDSYNTNSENITPSTVSATGNKKTSTEPTEKNDNLKNASTAAKEDNNLTKEKMLIYAMQDEYLAKKEYEIIMDKYGKIKPFSNIIEAEKKHVSQLTVLFNIYNIAIPEDNSKAYVVLPQTLNEAYKTGVTAEIDNIAMYDRFLKEDLPQDIKDTFTSLRDASKNHLAAFQNKVN